jgi:hypothetical protein
VLLPPLETKYIIPSYCDDLKPAITSIYEFNLVERVMTIFERSSGCKMHRTAESQKCKFLALGKWRKSLLQSQIPFDFFTLSDHLDFLGVTIKATFMATRKVNGEVLQDRVRHTIGPWRAGRFMPLNLRAHSINSFVYSKLLYRCNVIDIRTADIKYFVSQSKSFIYADLLEKPEELVLYRSTEDGGLGLNNIQCRAQAALISTFLQTAANPAFLRNHYHNALYRHYVLDELLPALPIPPHFKGNFFPELRALRASGEDLCTITFKTIYKSLLAKVLFGEEDAPPAAGQAPPPGGRPGQGPVGPQGPLLPIRCELALPTADWRRTWRLARLRGLGPDLTSFLLKMIWGILPTKERTHRILPHTVQSPDCRLCGQGPGERPAAESALHALVTCPANLGLPDMLLALLRVYIPGLRCEQMLAIDFALDENMELPLVWLCGALLCSLWGQRLQGRVCAARTRSELEARCRLLREGKRSGMQNAFVMAGIALQAMFQPGLVALQAGAGPPGMPD